MTNAKPRVGNPCGTCDDTFCQCRTRLDYLAFKCPRCNAAPMKPCVNVDDVDVLGAELSYIHPERVEEAARQDALNADPADLSPITDAEIVKTGLLF